MARLWRWVVVVLEEHVGAGVSGQADQVLVALQRLQEGFGVVAVGVVKGRPGSRSGA